MVSSHIAFGDASVSMTGNTVGYVDLSSSLSKVCDKDTPMLAVDVDGVQKRDIVPELLRKIRSKHELWLMTGIRNAGDVMDAFHGDINKLVIPYHLTSDASLKEIAEISDSCIPALFAGADGVRIKGKGKSRDLRTCVKALEKMNFRRIIVFDVSGDARNSVRDLANIVIPYAGTAEEADILRSIGFNNVLVSAIKLFRDASERSEVRSCMLP
jgi:isopentenyl phosphate kinase